jgi:hypothetical protein
MYNVQDYRVYFITTLYDHFIVKVVLYLYVLGSRLSIFCSLLYTWNKVLNFKIGNSTKIKLGNHKKQTTSMPQTHIDMGAHIPDSGVQTLQ